MKRFQASGIFVLLLFSFGDNLLFLAISSQNKIRENVESLEKSWKSKENLVRMQELLEVMKILQILSENSTRYWSTNEK